MGVEDQLFQKYGRAVAKGTLLFREGEQGNEMFIIQSGKVKITKKVGDVEKTLAFLPAGEFFGEMSILNNKPRSATAEVVEDAKLLVIDPKTFESMIRGNAEIAIRIIKKLSQRLQETDNQIEALLMKDHNRKVVYILKRWVEDRGAPATGGSKVKGTVQELSTQTGMDGKTVQDVLDKLIRAKLVATEADGFIVGDPKKLDKFLEFLAMKEQFGEFS